LTADNQLAHLRTQHQCPTGLLIDDHATEDDIARELRNAAWHLLDHHIAERLHLRQGPRRNRTSRAGSDRRWRSNGHNMNDSRLSRKAKLFYSPQLPFDFWH